MRAAVLWTGGKDSALALFRSTHLRVTELVTFVPPAARFRAHDLNLMVLQARSVGLPHRQIVVEEPYESGYERALEGLRADGVECVVTGDIAEVDGQSNFIAARAERVGMRVELPLWGVDRAEHLREIVASGFDVVLTLVKGPWLDETWVGRHLDVRALLELATLNRERGLDLAGENGEYHSMVLGGPGWKRHLAITGFTRSAGCQHYLEITGVHEVASSDHLLHSALPR
jgi:diphthine-ammonia ligase